MGCPDTACAPPGAGTQVLHEGWGAGAGWLAPHQGLHCPPSLCTGQSCDHPPHTAPGQGCGNTAGAQLSADASWLCFRPRGDQTLRSGVCPLGVTGHLPVDAVPDNPLGSPLHLCRGSRLPTAPFFRLRAGVGSLLPAPGPCTARRRPRPAGSPGATSSRSRNTAGVRVGVTGAARSALRPHGPGPRPAGGQTHRFPPGARRVQPAALAELQAAGVGHARCIVDLKPVGVIGDPAAAELQERRNGTLLERDPARVPPRPPGPAPTTPRLTSVWMMLQALVRPTLPGVPYRCRPFFRSCWAYLSICRTAGAPCGQLHPRRPAPRLRRPLVPALLLPAVTPPRRRRQALAPRGLPVPLLLSMGSDADASARASGG